MDTVVNGVIRDDTGMISRDVERIDDGVDRRCRKVSMKCKAKGVGKRTTLPPK